MTNANCIRILSADDHLLLSEGVVTTSIAEAIRVSGLVAGGFVGSWLAPNSTPLPKYFEN